MLYWTDEIVFVRQQVTPEQVLSRFTLLLSASASATPLLPPPWQEIENHNKTPKIGIL